MKPKVNFRVQSLVKHLIIVLVLVIVFALVGITIREVYNKNKLDQEIESLNQEINQLKIDQQNFLSSIDNFQSSFYLEQQARSKLNLKKNDENVVVVKLNESANITDINQSQDTSSGQPNNNNNSLIQKNIMLWWQYFFDQQM